MERPVAIGAGAFSPTEVARPRMKENLGLFASLGFLKAFQNSADFAISLIRSDFNVVESSHTHLISVQPDAWMRLGCKACRGNGTS